MPVERSVDNSSLGEGIVPASKGIKKGSMENVALVLDPVTIEGKGHSQQQAHCQETERPCQHLAGGLGWLGPWEGQP